MYRFQVCVSTVVVLVHVVNAGNQIFGGVDQRQRSLQNQSGVIQSPMYFKDQTGDGKITRADVIKARVEGYKK